MPDEPATPRTPEHADTTRTHEQMGRDAIGRTEAQVIGTSPIERTAIEREEELFTINMGPHHPATHGVLRLLVSLEGEVVRDLKPVMGYVHTGIEKSCEDKSYWKVIPFVERMDYLSYFFNMEAFCGAVEKLLELEIPPRAAYLRILHMELNRIHSHLVGLGTTRARPRRDLDVLVLLPRARQDPRPVRDVVGPADAHALLPGRRRRSRTSRSASSARCASSAPTCRSGSTSTRRCSTRTRSSCSGPRTSGSSRASGCSSSASPGRCCAPPASPGTCARSSDYLAYADFDFNVPIGTVGDNYDRYRVRLSEMRESVRIIEQAIDGLPEGPWIADDRKVVLPPRHELGTSMEALIHHFKLVTEGFRVPPGEAYFPIEGPRGELGCFVVADGSSKPVRVHMRDPSFVNLQALREMCVGGYVADLIANLAMLDPILGGIDR